MKKLFLPTDTPVGPAAVRANPLPFVLAALAVLAIVPASGSILFSDDFSTDGEIEGAFRLYHSDADGKWQADYTSNSGNPSDWEISGGQLTNPGIEAGKPSEGAAAKLISISTTDTSLNLLTFSFNYDVGAGTTLFFHAIGLVSNPTFDPPDPQILNTQAQHGTIQDQRESNYTDISLFDGTDPTGATSFAQSFTGITTGTYTATFDLSSFASSGTTGITSVADLDYIAVAFANDMENSDGSGAVSIDDFSISASASTAVPEASEAVLAALAVLGLLGFRRRKC